MSTTRSADTIYNVQMLRFLAAVMVLFGHVQHEIVTRPHLMGEHFREFSPLFWPGGVDIFFTISGFIMYHLARESFGRPGASVSFLLRRIVRVCPPYWFFTTLMIGSILMLPQHVQHGEVHLTHVLGSYLFFPVENYYGRNYPILILGWTLNFEMLFYVIFGVALLFRKVVGIALIIGVLGFLALSSIADIRFGGPFNFWGDSIVLEFLGGILIAHLRSVGVRLSPLASLTIFLAGLGLMVLIHSLNLTGQYWVWRFLWMGVPAFLICFGPSLMRETGRGLGRLGGFSLPAVTRHMLCICRIRSRSESARSLARILGFSAGHTFFWPLRCRLSWPLPFTASSRCP